MSALDTGWPDALEAYRIVTPQGLREQARGLRQRAAATRLAANHADDRDAYRQGLAGAQQLDGEATRLEREAARLEAAGG